MIILAFGRLLTSSGVSLRYSARQVFPRRKTPSSPLTYLLSRCSNSSSSAKI
jgi:hypothetical protein